MEIIIRKIEESDIEGLRETIGAVAREKKFLSVTDAFTLDQTTQYVSNNIANNYAQYVADLGGEIIGWADIVPGQRESTRHCGGLGIGILKAYRGQGVGGQLLANVIRHSWDNGLTRLQLDVYSDNHRAIALYQKHGYQYEGTKRNAILIDGRYRDLNVMAQCRL